MSRSSFIIPGPETVILWGVQVPLASAAFGVAGILLGHWIAPVIGAPLPLGRQAAMIAAGMLLSVGIAIATGQKPLVVLVWSIGIGFSGITIFQTIGKRTQEVAETLGQQVLDRLAAKKDGEPRA